MADEAKPAPSAEQMSQERTVAAADRQAKAVEVLTEVHKAAAPPPAKVEKAPPAEEKEPEAKEGEEPEEAKAEEKAEEPDKEKAEEKEDEDKLGPKLAELRKRERDLRFRENSVKQAQRMVAEHQAFTEQLRGKEPLSAVVSMMRQKGIDTTPLFEQLSEIGGQPKSKEEDERIKELLEWKRAREQKDAQTEQQTIYTSWIKSIHDYCGKDPERFEAIVDQVGEGSLALVYQALDAISRKTGSLPTEEDFEAAADLVESELREAEKAEIERKRKSKRWASSFAPSGDEKTERTPEPAKAKKASPPSTLTQRLSREAPQRKGRLTSDERLAEAIRLAEEKDLKL